LGATATRKTNIVAMRTLSEEEALARVIGKRIETSVAKLAAEWRWSTSKVRRRLANWSSAGHIGLKPGLGGRTVITPVLEAVASTPVDDRAPTAVAPAESVNSPPVGGRARTVAKKAERVAASPAGGDLSTAVAVPDPVATSPAGGDLSTAVAVPGAVSASPAGGDPSTAVAVPGAVAASPAGGDPSTAVAVPDPVTSPRAAGSVPTVVAAPRPTVAPEADTATEPPIIRAPSVVAVPKAIGPVSGPALRSRTTGFVNLLAYTVAVSLAGIAAYFSIRGMIVLFPGAPTAIVVMGVAMEAAKLVTVGFLAHQWRVLARLSRAVLVTLVAGLAAINAAGVYSQLVAAHFGDRVTATSAVETETAALAAKIEVQTQTVADLDRRAGQIDAAIAEMVRRGRTAGALEAIGAQRKLRETLVSQRRHEAETLANLKSEAGAVAAKTRQIEVEAAPIMYVAQLVGATTEQAIRLLILMMVLTCDPLALALTAAASRPRVR
jgi:hypothetical protein